MTRKDLNLLVLSAAEGQPLTPAQYQKCLFLLGKGYPDSTTDEWYDFQPYHFGAFDMDVYTDGQKLRDEGLVQIQRVPGGWHTYAATPEGLAKARLIAESAPPQVVGYARRLVEWARSLTFEQLIASVYKKYPDTKVNSIFRE